MARETLIHPRWQRSLMKLPANLSAVNCSMVSAHPFVYGLGQKTATGSYLSPANAIAYIAKKLDGVAHADIMVLMVCAKTYDEFLTILNQFSTVFPLPVLTQVARMAKTAMNLEITKMQLPAKKLGGLSKPQMISTASSRMLVNTQLIEQAKKNAASMSGIDAIKSAMSSFNAYRENTLKDINSTLTSLLGKSIDVWSFNASGAGDYLAKHLQINIPEPDAVLTLATLFAGNEISALKGLLHVSNQSTNEAKSNHHSRA